MLRIIMNFSSGDALEDDFDMDDKSQESTDEDSEDGKSGAKLGLDERRQKRAAGDHPLQEKFRETAKALSQKFGLLGEDLCVELFIYFYWPATFLLT